MTNGRINQVAFLGDTTTRTIPDADETRGRDGRGSRSYRARAARNGRSRGWRPPRRHRILHPKARAIMRGPVRRESARLEHGRTSMEPCRHRQPNYSSCNTAYTRQQSQRANHDHESKWKHPSEIVPAPLDAKDLEGTSNKPDAKDLEGTSNKPRGDMTWTIMRGDTTRTTRRGVVCLNSEDGGQASAVGTSCHEVRDGEESQHMDARTTI